MIEHDSDGESLFKLLEERISNFGLSLKNLIGCSFDGAANMKGQYKGLQARIKEKNPKLIYVHCMDHVLQLVIGDSTKKCRYAEDLFGLVEESALFIRQSHKRTLIWSKEVKKVHSSHGKLRRLKTIGVTRWWSKHKSLSAIIDFNEHEKEFSKFITFLNVLYEISIGNFDAKTKFLAKVLLEKWTKFETILMAAIMLDLFEVTSPVSEFLQSKQLDYSKAWGTVQTLLGQIQKKNCEEYFDEIVIRCQKFVSEIEALLETSSTAIDIQSEFSAPRVSSKKRMFDEKAKDEARGLSPKQKYRAAYFEMLNTAVNSIEERFLPNENLLKDCAWFDSRKFDDLCSSTTDIPNEDLVTVSNLANVNRDELVLELKQFVGQYKHFIGVEDQTGRPCPGPNLDLSDSDDNGEYDETEDFEEEDAPEPGNSKQKTRNRYSKKRKGKCTCLICIFFELSYLAEDGMFPTLYVVYKYVLTLPCTQVTCERCFSKLKILKTRLRSLLGQDNLSSLILIFVEKDLFIDIDKNAIIDTVANTSAELKRK